MASDSHTDGIAIQEKILGRSNSSLDRDLGSYLFVGKPVSFGGIKTMDEALPGMEPEISSERLGDAIRRVAPARYDSVKIQSSRNQRSVLVIEK